MPELPEVETSRIHVEKFCRGSAIVKCIAIEQGGGPRDGLFDDIVIGEDLTAQQLRETLEGRTVVELKRRGKQLWFVLDRPPHPLFHFGMTGAFTIKGERRHKFVKFKVSEEWPPKFTKLELQMSNGTCLALTDPRRLGRVRLREEPENQPPISVLGPDPLTHPLALETFAQALARIDAPIKAALLDQDRVVSGVGNWIADEVCFQACVHPGSACSTLAPEQVTALHTKLLSICRKASELRADYTAFPPDWLFHHRWGKGKASDGAPHVSSGHLIKFDVVGGRTTAFVPEIQRKGLLSPEQRKANQREQKKAGVKAETPKTETKSASRRKGGKRSIPNTGIEEKNGRSEAEARSGKTEIGDETSEQDGGEVKETRTRVRVTAKSKRGTRGTGPSSGADIKEGTQKEDAPARLRDAEVVDTKNKVPRKRKVSPSSPRDRESKVDIAVFSVKVKRKRSAREIKVAASTRSESCSPVGRVEGDPAIPRSPNKPASRRSRSGVAQGVGTRRSARLSNSQAS